MRLEHPDYITLVTEAYNRKRANNELSPLLAQSTPANIRRECLHVYRERYNKKDEQILRAFFGPAEPGRQFLQSIQELATDRFRPLDNYLKGDTEKTDDRNLELLAWLIDFRHRPFVYGMEVILNDDELYTIGRLEKDADKKQVKPGVEKDSLQDEEKMSAIDLRNPAEKETKKVTSNNEETEKLLQTVLSNDQDKRRTRLIVFFLIVAVCLGVTYAIWRQERNNQFVPGNANTGCMYWAGEHYEAMPCNEEQKGRLKLPMDPVKMKNFKRIIAEDTITEKSIGNVYYIRIDGRIEYYTTGGNHPVDVTRPLKPLSAYMFEKYLRKRENNDKVP
jgi:hypothetical protein